MKRVIASVFCAAALWVAGPVLGQGASGVVVELYTSQGCSSCPPADDYLMELAQEPGIIALALHVDYWDYIGWKDKFGNPDFANRQRAYAHAVGSTTIYTPQMIVAGVDMVEGSDPDRVSGDIRRHQSADAMVVLQLMRKGGKLAIRATPVTQIDQRLVVQLVRYRPHESVAIKHGENAGRTIDYANIVTSWTRIGDWDGQGELDMSVPVQGSDAVVVIVQAEGPGMIYAASVLR
jgi:hypothetical protein